MIKSYIGQMVNYLNVEQYFPEYMAQFSYQYYHFYTQLIINEEPFFEKNIHETNCTLYFQHFSWRTKQIVKHLIIHLEKKISISRKICNQ
jgi:hypothetical protein